MAEMDPRAQALMPRISPTRAYISGAMADLGNAVRVGGVMQGLGHQYMQDNQLARAQALQAQQAIEREQQQRQLLERLRAGIGAAGLDPLTTSMAQAYPETFATEALGAAFGSPPSQKLPASAIQYWQQREQLVSQYGEGSPQVNTFDTYVRAPQVYDAGGGQTNVNTPSGVRTLTTAEEATGREANLAGAKATAAAWANADTAFEQSAPGTITAINSQLAALDRIEADIESGRIGDTGFFEGRFSPYVKEAEAELQASAIDAVLNALQRVNLAPVTEKEIEMLMNLWPSVLKDPAANIGAIKAARRTLSSARDDLVQKFVYFRDNGTLAGFAQQMPDFAGEGGAAEGIPVPPGLVLEEEGS